TKDPARIFNVPALWEGSDARFHSRTKGDVMSVDELLSYAPPPPPPPQPVILPQTDLNRLKRSLNGKGKTIPVNDQITASKVVSTKLVDEYLALPKGAHHGGLYTFMAKVASRALFLGYEITPEDL